jgi:hypothetical protein
MISTITDNLIIFNNVKVVRTAASKGMNDGKHLMLSKAQNLNITTRVKGRKADVRSGRTVHTHSQALSSFPGSR